MQARCQAGGGRATVGLGGGASHGYGNVGERGVDEVRQICPTYRVLVLSLGKVRHLPRHHGGQGRGGRGGGRGRARACVPRARAGHIEEWRRLAVKVAHDAHPSGGARGGSRSRRCGRGATVAGDTSINSAARAIETGGGVQPAPPWRARRWRATRPSTRQRGRR